MHVCQTSGMVPGEWVGQTSRIRTQCRLDGATSRPRCGLAMGSTEQLAESRGFSGLQVSDPARQLSAVNQA